MICGHSQNYLIFRHTGLDSVAPYTVVTTDKKNCKTGSKSEKTPDYKMQFLKGVMIFDR